MELSTTREANIWKKYLNYKLCSQNAYSLTLYTHINFVKISGEILVFILIFGFDLPGIMYIWFIFIFDRVGAHHSVIACSIMLKAGRSRVRFTLSLHIFNCCNPSSRTMFSGVSSSGWRSASAQGWQRYRHLWADCLEKCGSFDVSRPYRPPRAVTEIQVYLLE
jgi:hypothetical protein